PIWLGGKTPRSLRRALALADGWDPFYLTVDELGTLLARARAWPEWHARAERGDKLTLVFSPDEVFDVALPEQRVQMAALLRRYAAIGTDVLTLRFRSTSCEHLLEQLDAFAREVAPEFAGA
ncbi:MAG TPA: hypothetical protein VHM19_02445, partial [Polyangiales bacterium]|nr:hypothetical protein [Polyangiales bacterium]